MRDEDTKISACFNRKHNVNRNPKVKPKATDFNKNHATNRQALVALIVVTTPTISGTKANALR